MRVLRCAFRPLTRTPVAPHRHRHTEWHFVLQGDCAFRIGARRIRICTADAFVIPAGVVHGVAMDAPQDWLLQYIVDTDADDDLVAAWTARAGSAGVLALPGLGHGFFAGLAADLATGDAWSARAAGHRFAAAICAAVAAPAPAQRQHPLVDAALAVMRRRLTGRLRLGELARLVGRDPAYLSRLFRSALGTPPMAAFTAMKLDLAAARLRGGGCTVGEAARQVGFDDPFHFSRAYRRHHGRPPSRDLPRS